MGCSSSKQDGVQGQQDVAQGKPGAGEKKVTMQVYTTADGFKDCLESGAVSLLRGRALVEQYESGNCIERRQDLPETSFWPGGEAMKILSKTNFGTNNVHLSNQNVYEEGCIYFLVALSYRWTEPGHPDLRRHHLAAMARYVQLHQEWLTQNGLLDDVGVFWDFPSLFQKARKPSQAERTDEQHRLFCKGLGSANIVYGHRFTWVAIQKSQPQGFEHLDYHKSGWCTFESAVSCLNKKSLWYLDISMVGKQMFPSFNGLVTSCVSSVVRPMVITPERMKQELKKAAFTNGKTDQQLVEDMYADIAHAVFAEASEINFNNFPWTPEDVRLMAEVLPMYSSATDLQLWNTAVGEEGAKVLAPVFSKMSKLKTMRLDCTTLGPDSHKLLADTLPPNLESLEFVNLGGSGNKMMLSGQGLTSFAEALAKWVHQTSAPKSLKLGHCRFSRRDEQIIEAAWSEAGKDRTSLVF